VAREVIVAESLIEQLQTGAVNSAIPITDLLRKAKLAAAKLQQVDFSTWIQRELEGYRGVSDEIPHYRLVGGDLKALNPWRGWVPIGIRTEMPITNAIAEVASHAGNESGFIHIGIPDDAADSIRQELDVPWDIKFHATCQGLTRIVDAVRNEVLDWTLKLENAGIRGEGLSFSPPEVAKAQALSIHNHFHAPIAGLNQGSGSITGTTQNNSSATPQEMAAALASLITMLQTNKAAGAPSAATTELVAAHKDLSAGRVPLARVRQILGGLKDAQDLAMRAPEVAQKIHALWQMFGG
jgi:hypothetical protein